MALNASLYSSGLADHSLPMTLPCQYCSTPLMIRLTDVTTRGCALAALHTPCPHCRKDCAPSLLLLDLISILSKSSAMGACNDPDDLRMLVPAETMATRLHTTLHVRYCKDAGSIHSGPRAAQPLAPHFELVRSMRFAPTSRTATDAYVVSDEIGMLGFLNDAFSRQLIFPELADIRRVDLSILTAQGWNSWVDSHFDSNQDTRHVSQYDRYDISVTPWPQVSAPCPACGSMLTAQIAQHHAGSMRVAPDTTCPSCRSNVAQFRSLDFWCGVASGHIDYASATLSDVTETAKALYPCGFVRLDCRRACGPRRLPRPKPPFADTLRDYSLSNAWTPVAVSNRTLYVVCPSYAVGGFVRRYKCTADLERAYGLSTIQECSVVTCGEGEYASWLRGL